MQNFGEGEIGCIMGDVNAGGVFRYFLNIYIYIFFFFFLSVACSHSRATQYFIASVHGTCSWTAYPCNSYASFRFGRCRACKGACSSMGFDADRTKRTGKFYLKTNRNNPFCGKFSSQKLKLPFFPSAVANSVSQDKLTLVVERNRLTCCHKYQ